MKKESKEPMHLAIAMVAMVAIVGIAAMVVGLKIPPGWNNAAWAATGHPQLEYAGQPSTGNNGGNGGSNTDLLPAGESCNKDSQCASGSCSDTLYQLKGGKLVASQNRHVCA